MKRIILTVLAITLVVSCGKKGLSEKEIAKYKAEGLRCLATGQYQQAVDNLLIITTHDDSSHTIVVALAEAYGGLEDYEAAVKWLNTINDYQNEEIKDKILAYRGSGYLKDIARVDWEIFKDKKWTYVIGFNDKYSKYRQDGKYGLLDLNYEVALPAKYAEIFTVYEPSLAEQIVVFKETEDAQANDWSQAIILDEKLTETAGEVPVYGSEEAAPVGYFVDTGNDDLLMEAYYEQKDGYVVTEAGTLDKDRVVNGAAACDNDYCLASYEKDDSYFLVNKADRFPHKLEGIPQDYLDGQQDSSAIVDDMIAMTKNGRCGYYNKDGIKIDDFHYQLLNDTGEDRARCATYREGYVTVRSGSLLGLLNNRGVPVVPAMFDGISAVVHGRFLVIYQGKVDLARLK